jgi:DNA repair protein SbcD/Mre11
VKVLHTSDWHLGARLGRHDRLPDQRVALRGLLELAEAVKPDLILHSGDVFDARRPPYEALSLGVHVLTRLATTAPTVVVSGNHDSPQLLRIIHDLAGMPSVRRLWMITAPRVATIPGLEQVALACVPFIPLTAVGDMAADDPRQFEGRYADGIRHLNDDLLDLATEQAGPRGVVLYVAHLHVHGARPSRSERRITVGEDYATHVEGLNRAMYSALGHIHDPQLLPGGTATGRYAGSIVPLDFGEAVQQKQVLVVTICDGDVRVEEHPLPAGRQLTEFSGTIDELDALAADGGLNGRILKARVLSGDPVTDLAAHVLAPSPECAIFEIVNSVTNAPVRRIDTSAEPEREPGIRELFNEWRATVARGITAPHKDVTTLFSLAVDNELAEGSELGTQGVMAAAQGALDELTQGRDQTAARET